MTEKGRGYGLTTVLTFITMDHVFQANSAVRPGVSVTPAGNDNSSSKTTPENPDGKNSSQVWAYAAEGTQLALTLLIGVFIGYKIDARWNTSPWFTLGFAVVCIVVGMFNFLRRALKW